VYTNFPKRFADKAKGEGHELHDAELLLSLYREWAVKMYPYAPAEDTLRRVEKLGKDRAVKSAVREFHERDHGGGVGDAVAAMEKADAHRAAGRDDEEEDALAGEDVFYGDEDEDDDGDALDDDEHIDMPDDEEDYDFGADEDDAQAMREAEAEMPDDVDDEPEAESSDDDEGEDNAEEDMGKRGKKAKGASDLTKSAFEQLAKKVGKKVGSATPGSDDDGMFNPNSVNSPHRKILRVRPKILDASSDEDDAAEEPKRRRRAVQLEDEDDE
jgi:hypothetical protein